MSLDNAPIRRRLLFLVPFPPRLDGTHGGSRAIAQLLLHLASRHDIALLYLRASDEPCLDQALAAVCAVAEEVQRPLRARSAFRRLIHPVRIWSSLLLCRPPWVTDWAVPAFAASVRTLVRTWRPDIVHIEFQIMAQYTPALSGSVAPQVLTVHEPATQATAEMRRLGLSAGRCFPAFEQRAWHHYERKIFARVQTVVVFTEADRQVLAPLSPRTTIACIPLGTPLPEQALSPYGGEPPGIVFVGSFVHPPNLDAVLRLVHTIMPQLWTRFPELRLTIVGERPPPSLHRQVDRRVRITGRVPDVTPYLDDAAVVVIPLRFGGGMRVKVLEALAAGKAIVASPRSAMGLDLKNGEQIILVEEDDEFVEAISELLADKERRAAIATQARAMAMTHLGWNAAVRSYETLYAQLSADQLRDGNYR